MSSLKKNIVRGHLLINFFFKSFLSVISLFWAEIIYYAENMSFHDSFTRESSQIDRPGRGAAWTAVCLVRRFEFVQLTFT